MSEGCFWGSQIEKPTSPPPGIVHRYVWHLARLASFWHALTGECARIRPLLNGFCVELHFSSLNQLSVPGRLCCQTLWASRESCLALPAPDGQSRQGGGTAPGIQHWLHVPTSLFPSKIQKRQPIDAQRALRVRQKILGW